MAGSALNRHIVRAPVPGTAADDQDMRRMRKPQELNVWSVQCSRDLLRTTDILKRVYSVVTLVGYAVIIGLTWPFSLVYVQHLSRPGNMPDASPSLTP
jgi:hypothetical protein